MNNWWPLVIIALTIIFFISGGGGGAKPQPEYVRVGVFFPGKRLRKDEAALEQIERAFQGRGEKVTEVVRGFGFYPSDNASFKRGVGVCALKKKRLIGYYMDRIHTNKDTVLEEENIELLRVGAVRFAEFLREKDLT